MSPAVRTALVIARRDFTATVMSRTFLLFLIAPLFPLLFALLFGAAGGGPRPPDRAPTVTVEAARPADLEALRATLARLEQGQAPLLILSPAGDAAPLSGLMLRIGGEGGASLSGPADALEPAAGRIGFLFEEMARDRALAAAGARPVAMPLRLVPLPATAADRPGKEQGRGVGQAAVTALFVVTLMLAGMLLSNFIEEKANKVIEVLAAAAPVPAIFTGKLFAMLGSSLVGLCLWGGTAAAVYLGARQGGLPPAPPIGWPAFALLAVAYFTTNYLLIGALLLGVGAQASSVRQVQTLSLPITFAQLLLYGFAAAGAGEPEGGLARAAALFPYSSPLAMIGRAAQMPGLGWHIAALVWQTGWVALTILIASRLFRRGVLKSGGR